MRWIQDNGEYRELRDIARTCVDIDSGRRPTEKIKLYFCDLEGLTPRFSQLVQDLLIMAREQSCFYMVLDPDPEFLWHDQLGGYAVFEISRGDSAEEYIKFLNQPIGNNPGGNMTDMWYSYVIFPSSLRWFVHTIRSDRDDTGHLWVPPEWADEIAKLYPLVRHKPSE